MGVRLTKTNHIFALTDGTNKDTDRNGLATAGTRLSDLVLVHEQDYSGDLAGRQAKKCGNLLSALLTGTTTALSLAH